MNRMIILTCAAALALAGCAPSEHAASHRPPPTTSVPPAQAAQTAQPSAAAQMICTAETHATVQQILGLTSTPRSTSTWAGLRYTCTYALPQGRLTLSVDESATPAAARAYAAALRTRLGSTEPVAGLTDNAYGTRSGTIVLTKDNDTLRVDASALPPVVGTQHAKRFDFAYELASDILGCWTGEDGS